MKKRLLSVIVAFAMMLSLFPAQVLAAQGTPVASVDGTDYTSFDSAWSAAARSGTHTLRMAANWNPDERLEVPSGCTLTIEMDCFTINRNNTSSTSPHSASDSGGDGGVFHLNSGAKLTVRGTEIPTGISAVKRGTVRDGVWFYDNVGNTIFTGALITGGATDSKGGGAAFKVEENAVLTLENVTVAGNVADSYGLLYGSAGAIMLNDDGAQLNMVNSRIAYNYAYRDGGGVYVDGEECTITMKNSYIDNNRCGTDGGGIFSNQQEFTLTLDASTINGNTCGGDGGGICYSDYTTVDKPLNLKNGSEISWNTAGDEGGAIYVGGEDLTVSGGTFDGNKAKTGGAIYFNNDVSTIKNATLQNNAATTAGGAIFFGETECQVINCRILNNSAANGGGVYVEEEDNVIDSCTVTGNTATSEGGGIYVPDELVSATMELYLTGKCVVKDNYRMEGNKAYASNLVLDDSSYIRGTASPGSEIHLECGARQLSHTAGTFVETAYYCDKANTYIEWDLDTNSKTYRQLFVKSGAPQIHVTQKELVPGKETAPVVTDKKYTVSGFGGGIDGDYPVLQGFSRTETDKKLLPYFYSDGYFFNDPFKYDTHLATMSLCFEISAANANSSSDSLGNQIGYSNRFRAVKQFLSDIGCDDAKTFISDSFTVQPTKDTIGYAIGQKALSRADGSDSGYTLIPIAVRGQGYEAEWASNVTLGTEGEAAGFRSAANQVFSKVQEYIKKYALEDQISAGKVRFWIVGYSRAGATANLTAKRLLDAYQGTGNVVYGYTFEAPQGGVASAMKSGVDYDSIHNTINYSDFVPYVAPVDMDFMRYGVDHYVPGSAAAAAQSFTRSYAGSLNGSETVDKSGKSATAVYRKDNDWYDTDTENYRKQRALMLRQLYATDETMVFDDYFHIAEMNLLTSWIYGWFEEDGDGDVTMAEFLQDFFHYMQRWTFDNESREYYSEVYEYDIALLLDTFMRLPSENMNNVMSRLSGITNQLWNILHAIVINWYVDNELDDYFISETLYDALIAEKIIASDAIPEEVFSSELVHMALKFFVADRAHDADEYEEGTLGDYDSDTNIVQIGTFAYNISNIVLNHMPLLNLAWLRSYDSYYTENETLYTTTYSVRSAAVDEVGKPVASIAGAPVDAGVIYGGPVAVELQNAAEDQGGAIYYTVTRNGEPVGEENTLYRGLYGIVLEAPEEGTAEYRIDAHTMWYDTPGETASFTVTVGQTAKYLLTVNGEARGFYASGEQVSLDGARQDVDFAGWALPEDVRVVSGGETTPQITFCMPERPVELAASYREKPRFTVSTDKSSYETDEAITVTVKAPESVEKVYLTNESGTGLASSREKTVNGDGTATWKLVLSLETVGDRVLSVFADGEDTGLDAKFAVVYPAASGEPEILSVIPPFSVRANEAFTTTIVTNSFAENVRLFNENGAGMMPSECSFVEKDGKRIWTYTIAVGTAGDRRFTAKACAQDKVYVGTAQVWLKVA